MVIRLWQSTDPLQDNIALRVGSEELFVDGLDLVARAKYKNHCEWRCFGSTVNEGRNNRRPIRAELQARVEIHRFTGGDLMLPTLTESITLDSRNNVATGESRTGIVEWRWNLQSVSGLPGEGTTFLYLSDNGGDSPGNQIKLKRTLSFPDPDPAGSLTGPSRTITEGESFIVDFEIVLPGETIESITIGINGPNGTITTLHSFAPTIQGADNLSGSERIPSGWSVPFSGTQTVGLVFIVNGQQLCP